jgi:hypothetical protein
MSKSSSSSSFVLDWLVGVNGEVRLLANEKTAEDDDDDEDEKDFTEAKRGALPSLLRRGCRRSAARLRGRGSRGRGGR